MTRPALPLLMTLCGILLAQTQLRADSWPMLAHDAGRSAYTSHGLLLPRVMTFAVDLPGFRATGAALAEGALCVVTQEKPHANGIGPLTLLCLEPMSGAPRWSVSLGEGRAGSPLIAEGRVIVAVYDGATAGRLSAYSLATGQPVWSALLPSGSIPEAPAFIPSPAYFEGRVWMPGKAGAILRFVAANGNSAASIATGLTGPGSAPPTAVAATDAGVFATGVSGARFGQPFGQAAWTAAAQGDDLIPFVQSGTYLIFSGAGSGVNGPLQVLASADGRYLWSDLVKPLAMATDGLDLFVASDRGALLAFAPNTGYLQWVAPGEAPGSGLMVAGRTVFLGDGAGLLRAFDALSGVETWRFPTGGTPGAWFHLLAADGYEALGKEGDLLVALRSDGLLMGFQFGVYGDLTGDGQVSVTDAVTILRAIVGLTSLSPERRAAADVAPVPGAGRRPLGDGRVDVSDLVSVLRRSVGLQPSSWPFPPDS